MNDAVIIWLYVIRSLEGKYYTGITNDISRRLKEHRGGESKSTKNYRGIELVWTKVFRDRKEARAMEVRIKKRGAARWLKVYGGACSDASAFHLSAHTGRCPVLP